MRRNLLLFIFLACVTGGWAQPDSVDTWAAQDWSIEAPDEEDYGAYFRPATTGNGDYLPIGQLTRSGIGVRLRPRGYDYRYQRYSVAGLDLSDPTDGFPYWNLIAAIDLMPRTHRDASGLSPGENGLGGLDGTAAVSLTDRFIPSGGRFSYAFTNRTYRHRVTASFRTVSENGWGVSAGISGRDGRDGFVEGLSSRRVDASALIFRYFGNQTFSLLAAATDSRQGVRSATTQEVYDLARTNYYNPNWGMQSGTVRPARERTYRQYLGAFTWEGRWERWEAQAGASFFGGENGYSLPAWYDAPTPYADYYRSLPGFYFDSETARALRREWLSGNTAVTQIDWRDLYEANRYNVDPNGISRSHYILRELVTDKQNIQIQSNLRYNPSGRLTFRGGIRYRSDRSDSFARLKDLLGGSYWLDIDQYLLDDEYYGAQVQNDMRNPNRPVFEGQKFGYNYRISSNTLKGWILTEYRSSAFEFFAGIEAGTMDFQREGFYEKELFPGNLSFGLSEKIEFQEYMAKAGAFRNLSLRQRLGVQAMIGEQAPLVKNLFIAPQFRNAALDPQPVRIAAGEVVYRWNSPELMVEITGYLTVFHNDSEIRGYYDDLAGEYLDFVMTDIDKRHGGLELGAEWNVTPNFSLLGALSLNAYKYANDPSAILLRDSDGAVLLSGEPVFLKGLRLSGTPQAAALLQFNYRTRDYWRFELSARQTAHNYVSISPMRRMNRMLDAAGSSEAAQGMLAQERLDDAFLLGLAVSKTFRLRGGNRIGLWIHADNLTDNRSIRYSGFEQGRFSKAGYAPNQTLVPFPSKYYYAYGFNVYAQISYQF